MNIEIANRLVQYRKDRGMSQEELAAALGLSRQAVSKWERAEASPDTDNLIALARLYGVSLDALLLAEESSTIVLEGEPPAAPDPPMPKYPSQQEAIGSSYEATAQSFATRYQQLSPGAQTMLKLMGLAAAVACFLVYGVLSWIFPGLGAAYAPLCTIIYLVCGFLFDLWHPSWLIFVTVPLFYTLF